MLDGAYVYKWRFRSRSRGPSKVSRGYARLYVDLQDMRAKGVWLHHNFRTSRVSIPNGLNDKGVKV